MNPICACVASALPAVMSGPQVPGWRIRVSRDAMRFVQAVMGAAQEVSRMKGRRE